MKSAPQRMCTACRVHTDKAALLRFVAGKDGVVVLDASDTMPGRGAYLCKKQECISKAKKNRALSRALSAKAEDSFYEELLNYIHG